MQLGRPPTDSDAEDVGCAMRDAAGYGQRPAVVVLRPGGRQEQGFGTLLQWAAKISHWLESDHDLGPDGTLGLVSPPGWLPAAAALGAWWTGVAVATGGMAGTPVVVVHEHAAVPTGVGEVAMIGDAFDGSPTRPDGGTPEAESLTTLTQLFPDQPPGMRARPDTPALRTPVAHETQRELLERAHGWTADGPLGLTVDCDPHTWLPAVALRPLVTGHATVVLDRVDRDAAAAEGVAGWI